MSDFLLKMRFQANKTIDQFRVKTFHIEFQHDK